jgi:hypothetical protein
MSTRLSLGYTPAICQKSDVVFISKPAKIDYGDPRAFSPISLTCFIFKALERLVMWRLEESCLKTHPHNENQFAFRKGRSTEHAISKMVDYVETHTAKLDSYVVSWTLKAPLTHKGC